MFNLLELDVITRALVSYEAEVRKAMDVDKDGADSFSIDLEERLENIYKVSQKAYEIKSSLGDENMYL